MIFFFFFQRELEDRFSHVLGRKSVAPFQRKSERSSLLDVFCYQKKHPIHLKQKRHHQKEKESGGSRTKGKEEQFGAREQPHDSDKQRGAATSQKKKKNDTSTHHQLWLPNTLQVRSSIFDNSQFSNLDIFIYLFLFIEL